VNLALALDTVRTRAQHKRTTGRSTCTIKSTAARRTRRACAGQEFATHRGQTLDIALRYSPSFLVKGLIIKKTSGASAGNGVRMKPCWPRTSLQKE
jgi:hypothetical protein